MVHFIDKDALVAEIERLISNGQVKLQESQESNDNESYVAWAEHIATCIKVLSFINTLEVKEVDLEREMQAFAALYLEPLKISDSNIGISITMSQLYSCAKHFFELGMAVSNKAQKGE